MLVEQGAYLKQFLIDHEVQGIKREAYACKVWCKSLSYLLSSVLDLSFRIVSMSFFRGKDSQESTSPYAGRERILPEDDFLSCNKVLVIKTSASQLSLLLIPFWNCFLPFTLYPTVCLTSLILWPRFMWFSSVALRTSLKSMKTIWPWTKNFILNTNGST